MARRTRRIDDPLPDFSAGGFGESLFARVEPASRRRLLLSALAAFASSGFHAATTREIGEGAGMSSASMYVHYASKAEILAEISRIGHQEALDAVRSALDGAPEAHPARVHEFVFAFAMWHAKNHVLARVIQYELASIPSGDFQEIVDIRKTIQGLLRTELEAGVSAGALSVLDLDGTVNAALSLCIDLGRWYGPSSDRTDAEISELFAALATRMVLPRTIEGPASTS